MLYAVCGFYRYISVDELLCLCLQSLSEEIILTLGEAFEVAYQIALHSTAIDASNSAHEPASNIPVAATNSRRVIPYSTAL